MTLPLTDSIQSIIHIVYYRTQHGLTLNCLLLLCLFGIPKNSFK
ncbi:hypothetical protein ACQUFW_00205 [Acinetobacter johnsonii]